MKIEDGRLTVSLFCRNEEICSSRLDAEMDIDDLNSSIENAILDFLLKEKKWGFINNQVYCENCMKKELEIAA